MYIVKNGANVIYDHRDLSRTPAAWMKTAAFSPGIARDKSRQYHDVVTPYPKGGRVSSQTITQLDKTFAAI